MSLQFLRDEGLYESREELERREDVLGRLSELAQVRQEALVCRSSVSIFHTAKGLCQSIPSWHR